MKPLTNTKALFCFFSILFFFGYQNTAAAQDARFVCGGAVENQVWSLWDTGVRDQLRQNLIQDRLLKQGDVYGLYFFQVYTHNMVSMARRCNRKDRLLEVAQLIQMAYASLDKSISAQQRRWIHTKGSYRGKEVMLCSVQFLGLASSVANALATSSTPLNNEEKAFIRDTVQIIVEHLLRWGDKRAMDALQKNIAARPEDIKEVKRSSTLLFTDRELWQITIYAELAGILQANDRQKLGLRAISPEDKKQLQKHLSMLLKFFVTRVSIQRAPHGRLGNVDVADLDRGYWRLFETHLYADYDKSTGPIEYVPAADGKSKFVKKIKVPLDKVHIRQDTGWDFSHARRLVHALDALERNRLAVKNVFYLHERQLPPESLPAAFANTLVATIWNGDTEKPLFSNYWSGANGWFRVGYDGGSGFSAGTPPYGMTDSFLAGGYVTWSKYSPIIGSLGRRFYDLTNSAKGDNDRFMDTYYKQFSKGASAKSKNINKFMFYPSLVGI